MKPELEKPAFNNVRDALNVIYWIVWIAAGILSIALVATVIYSLAKPGAPANDLPMGAYSLVLSIVGVYLVALVFTWMLTLTICQIDSRNLLVEMHQLQLSQHRNRAIENNSVMPPNRAKPAEKRTQSDKYDMSVS